MLAQTGIDTGPATIDQLVREHLRKPPGAPLDAEEIAGLERTLRRCIAALEAPEASEAPAPMTKGIDSAHNKGQEPASAPAS